MKTIRWFFVASLAFGTCAGAQSFEWEKKDSSQFESSPRMRLDEANRRLDDLRDNATADDYRTIRIQGKNGRPGGYRRVPTEEFAARIEQAEQDRDIARAEARLRERSLY